MDAIVFWHWWVLGFALLIAEILLPSTFCLWLGASAFITGIAAWLIPGLHWQTEVVVFAVLSFVAVGAWFRFRPQGKALADHGLNQRGQGYVGQVFDLVEPIQNGFGKARVEDSVWRVAGPDLPLGSRVCVTAVDGATLRVEPAH
ncbi:MAG: NfeD family protein [Stagnimonas sp.]|nr:NfeD family protein [Stagnimonas sp.]